jgi:hypothetical protein
VAKKRPGWALAIGLSCLGVAFLAIMAGTGFAEPPPVAYAAVITLSLGLALLWTARTGRSKAMLGVAVAAVFATCGLAAAEVESAFLPLPSAQSSPALAVPAPEAWMIQDFNIDSDVPEQLEAVAQDVHYDFSALGLESDARTKINATASNVTVLLPEDVGYEVIWKVKAGTYNESRSGSPVTSTEGLSISGNYARSIAGEPTLTLEIEVQAGSLSVERS